MTKTAHFCLFECVMSLNNDNTLQSSRCCVQESNQRLKDKSLCGSAVQWNTTEQVEVILYILTWVLPPASDSGALHLGGLEPNCPDEGVWVLRGAVGRARADGLVGVWGMGNALCTGLGLGSPDFIFEATRMAGIFFLATWELHARRHPQLAPLPEASKIPSYFC